MIPFSWSLRLVDVVDNDRMKFIVGTMGPICLFVCLFVLCNMNIVLYIFNFVHPRGGDACAMYSSQLT